MVEAARASGVRISANMYPYNAGATGLDAAMPPWVQDGGLEAWIARLKDPAARARVKADLDVAHPVNWENYATYEKPAQLATGVDNVLVNDRFAFRDGKPTGAATGRVVRGRGWTGAPNGGCRASASDWH